jgi:flagellar assembly protein FliH
MMNSLSSAQQNGPFIKRFTYPSIGAGGEPATPPSGLNLEFRETEGLTEEQAKAREASAYGRGLAEGQQRALLEAQSFVQQAKSSVADTVAEFARERESYFQDVEAEVIALSLAIARKILNRETQVDPLVLKGVVYSALERLSSGTSVRLHVPPDQLEAWRHAFAKGPGRAPAEIVADASLVGNECQLETALGNSHLNVENQLKEIEQGFADLLARSPRSSP